MFFLGQVEHGAYIDEYSGINPDVLQEYYGVEGRTIQRLPGQSGAGHPDDENEEEEGNGEAMDIDIEDLPDRIAQDLEHNFNHEAVKTPKHRNPFKSDLAEEAFTDEILKMTTNEEVPRGYGMRRDEWEEGDYPTYEVIRTGRRGRKELCVDLPDDIWRPRAMLWVRALYNMTMILELQMDIDSDLESD